MTQAVLASTFTTTQTPDFSQISCTKVFAPESHVVAKKRRYLPFSHTRFLQRGRRQIMEAQPCRPRALKSQAAPPPRLPAPQQHPSKHRSTTQPDVAVPSGSQTNHERDCPGLTRLSPPTLLRSLGTRRERIRASRGRSSPPLPNQGLDNRARQLRGGANQWSIE